jgi:hypothetical protein
MTDSTAFLRPRGHSPSASFQDQPEGSLPDFGGLRVAVVSGPLAGAVGAVRRQLDDGRWAIELADCSPGVLFCLDARYLRRV